MPFGQAGVEPALIVSGAVPSFWDWVLVGGQGWATVLGSTPHPTPFPPPHFLSGGPGSCWMER